MQHDNLVKIPQHLQQKRCLLLEARTHLVWTGDENVQEHQLCEQVLFFPPAIKPKQALDKHLDQPKKRVIKSKSVLQRILLFGYSTSTQHPIT